MDYDSLNYIGLIYFKQEEYDDAIKYLLKSLEINPDFDLSLSNLALVYFTMSIHDKALYYYKRVE